MHEAKLEKGKIIVEKDPEEVFELGAYGRLKDGKLVMKSYEAMNLIHRKKLEVLKDGEALSEEQFYREAVEMEESFTEKLLVYDDLRKRGFVVRPGYSFPCDLRVYERGTSFSADEKKLNHVKWLLDVVKTNSPFCLLKKTEKLGNAGNIRADLGLGIVDEEGDVTYYEIDEEKKLNEAEGFEAKNEDKVEGFLEGDNVIVWEDIDKIYEPHYFGKRREDRLELNLLESVYLMEEGLLAVERNGGPVSKEEMLDIAREEDCEFDEKYEIYKDLRDKGFLVRSGFKFGTHFRVYDRGVELKKGQKSPDEHTKWVVHAVPKDFSWSYPELSRFVRLALNIRSKPTLGVVNKSKKYYRIRRIKP